MRILFLILTMGLLQTGCTSVDPVMSKAGVMTHPDCAKYSTEEAVATCESGLRQRGGSSRFSFGIGVTRILDWTSLFILKYNSDGVLQSPLQTLILLARSVTSFDGDKYEGEYKEGEFNGQGIFTSFNGKKYVGEFKDGNFWNGTTYEIDGNFFGKLVNGKLKVK